MPPARKKNITASTPAMANPSTSFGTSSDLSVPSTIVESSFGEAAAQSVVSTPVSAAPKKESHVDLVVRAIEEVGVPRKGASYIAILKWITSNNESNTRVKTYLKKAIEKALAIGFIKRPTVSQDVTGMRGFFIINKEIPKTSAKKSSKAPVIKALKDPKSQETVNKAKESVQQKVKRRKNVSTSAEIAVNDRPKSKKKIVKPNPAAKARLSSTSKKRVRSRVRKPENNGSPVTISKVTKMKVKTIDNKEPGPSHLPNTQIGVGKSKVKIVEAAVKQGTNSRKNAKGLKAAEKEKVPKAGKKDKNIGASADLPNKKLGAGKPKVDETETASTQEKKPNKKEKKQTAAERRNNLKRVPTTGEENDNMASSTEDLPNTSDAHTQGKPNGAGTVTYQGAKPTKTGKALKEAEKKLVPKAGPGEEENLAMATADIPNTNLEEGIYRVEVVEDDFVQNTKPTKKEKAQKVAGRKQKEKVIKRAANVYEEEFLTEESTAANMPNTNGRNDSYDLEDSDEVLAQKPKQAKKAAERKRLLKGASKPSEENFVTAATAHLSESNSSEDSCEINEEFIMLPTQNIKPSKKEKTQTASTTANLPNTNIRNNTFDIEDSEEVLVQKPKQAKNEKVQKTAVRKRVLRGASKPSEEKNFVTAATAHLSESNSREDSFEINDGSEILPAQNIKLSRKEKTQKTLTTANLPNTNIRNNTYDLENLEEVLVQKPKQVKNEKVQKAAERKQALKGASKTSEEENLVDAATTDFPESNPREDNSEVDEGTEILPAQKTKPSKKEKAQKAEKTVKEISKASVKEKIPKVSAKPTRRIKKQQTFNRSWKELSDSELNAKPQPRKSVRSYSSDTEV